MTKKKALVYDSQNCFSRFLKYEFRDNFSFDVYKNFKKFNNCTEHYSIIIFAIHSEKELFDLMRIYRKGVPLIVSTLNEEIKLRLENIEDLLIFDSSKLKSEMRVELKFYLTVNT